MLLERGIVQLVGHIRWLAVAAPQEASRGINVCLGSTLGEKLGRPRG